MNSGMSSNGRTHDSGSWYRGSNPCIPAIKAVIIVFNDDRFLVLIIQGSPFWGLMLSTLCLLSCRAVFQIGKQVSQLGRGESNAGVGTSIVQAHLFTL